MGCTLGTGSGNALVMILGTIDEKEVVRDVISLARGQPRRGISADGQAAAMLGLQKHH
jgi:hypothetical protein